MISELVVGGVRCSFRRKRLNRIFLGASAVTSTHSLTFCTSSASSESRNSSPLVLNSTLMLRAAICAFE